MNAVEWLIEYEKLLKGLTNRLLKAKIIMTKRKASKMRKNHIHK